MTTDNATQAADLEATKIATRNLIGELIATIEKNTNDGNIAIPALGVVFASVVKGMEGPSDKKVAAAYIIGQALYIADIAELNSSEMEIILRKFVEVERAPESAKAAAANLAAMSSAGTEH